MRLLPGPEVAKLPEERALLLAQIGRKHHLDAGQEVTPFTWLTFQPWHSLAPQPEHPAGLRLRRDSKSELTFRRWHNDFTTQNRCVQRYLDLGAKIVVVALESRIWPDRDIQIDITVGSTGPPGPSLPGDSDARSRCDTGWYLYFNCLGSLDHACPVACGTDCASGEAGSFAERAGLAGLKLDPACGPSKRFVKGNFNVDIHILTPAAARRA